jgi:transmembrane sensor
MLVAEANRGSARPISIADPTLAARRVSGRFRVDDTRLLAPQIGALLGARVDTRDLERIVLGPARK